MIKKSIFGFAVAGFFAVPLFSFAAVINTGVSVAVATSSVAVPPGNVVAVPPVIALPVCYPFNRSLRVGVSGADVTMLQNDLKAQGYFNGTPTGYFGVLTKAAVGEWQAENGVVALGGSGSGIFGPMSRAAFQQLCTVNDGGGTGVSTSTAVSFSANPQSGSAPLTVQFIASAPQGTTLGNAVDFGDGTKGTLGYVPVCSNCHAEGVVSHTYAIAGTYTAMLTSGTCSCPVNSVCNCPMIQILATTTIVVAPANNTASATSSIQQLNASGTVMLTPGGIAELRNLSIYFTLEDIASSSATIQITPVGCWNSFPSDPPRGIVCMLALVPIPPQTLAVGQTYNAANYSITLTQLSSTTATFAVK